MNEHEQRLWLHTCRRWRSVVHPSSTGGHQTAWGESDVIQANVSLWISTHFALKHDLKVPDVAQWNLPHLPVVALISCQVQKEMKIPLTSSEHAEGADAVSRHVEVETHLEKEHEIKILVILKYENNKYKIVKIPTAYKGKYI